MATDYVPLVSSFGWDELDQLWRMIEAHDTPGWPDGKAFEHRPYGVSLNGQVVEQIDGTVAFDHITCLIEAKDTKDPVNVEPIAKLRNQLMRRPAGVLDSVFSFSGFTDPARTLAQYRSPQAILLWNGMEVAYLLRQRSFKEAFIRKFEYLVRMSVPDFDIREETIA